LICFDLGQLVNEAFEIEEVSKSKELYAFRAEPRINLNKLETELQNSQTTKWIVLETPLPEELVVATCAITMTPGTNTNNNRGKEAQIRCFSVLKSKQGQNIGNQLLRITEAICRGHGCSNVKIDIAMVRNDIIEWFKRYGYKNMAGGAWMHDAVVDATQYLTMMKDLTKPDNFQKTTHNHETKPIVQSQASTEPVPDTMSSLLELTQAFAESLGDLPDFDNEGDEMQVEYGDSMNSNMTFNLPIKSSSKNTEIPPTSTSTSTSTSMSTSTSTGNSCNGSENGPDLEDLLGILMSQLKTPSGKQQFDELVAAEERNVLGIPINPTDMENQGK
jgi:N-acetylglutamate synthase-like GNAT family acetyltransferase